MATYQSVRSGDTLIVAPHLERADRSLQAAELLRDAGLHEDSVSRAHQAAVHVERALLGTGKRSPQDPRSVHRLATLHFLQNDRLDPSFTERVERLLTLRNRADSQPDASIDAETCCEALDEARAFAAAAQAFLRAEGYIE